MKNILKFSGSTFANAGQKVYTKLSYFATDQRGEGGGKAAVGVFSIFTAVVIIIILFAVFKEQLPAFVENKIFGKMNSIE